MADDYRAIGIFLRKKLFFNIDKLFFVEKALISCCELVIVSRLEIALSHGVEFGSEELSGSAVSRRG